MAIALLESLTTDFLENQYFLCLYVIGKNSSLHYYTINIWSTYLNGAAILNEQYFVKLNTLVILGSETVYKDFRASLNLELLTCNIYNCVHK